MLSHVEKKYFLIFFCFYLDIFRAFLLLHQSSMFSQRLNCFTLIKQLFFRYSYAIVHSCIRNVAPARWDNIRSVAINFKLRSFI